ncbi:MAG: sulfatase-like hydrolase/transferase [Ruminococcus sp.]|nr:sulfatase-like hydrolase/transferase [Ruminococcus sp.]
MDVKSIAGAPESAVTETSLSDRPQKTPRKRLLWFAEPILLCFAVCFAVFVLSPLYAIGDNQIDFPLTAAEILPPVMLAGGVFALLLSGVLLILKRFAGKVYIFASRLLVGFIAAFFVQAVFLNSSTTAMTGYKASYAEINAELVADTLIYLLVISAPMILHCIAAKHPLSKKMSAMDRKAVLAVSAAALAVQLCWAGIKAAKTDLSQYGGRFNGYLSYSQTMSLSEKGNVVVILSDRLDGNYLDTMLEKYPDIADKFSGFTYYQNNVSHSTNTFPSVAQMLTGKLYDGGEWPAYMEKAWDDDCLPGLLKANGYDVYIVPDSVSTVASTRIMSDYCDNISKYDDPEMNYTGVYGIVHASVKLSLARLMPDVLKGAAAGGLGTCPGSYFYVSDSEPHDRIPFRIKPYTDIRYYDHLRENGLNADCENKTFSFIHFSASHNLSSELAGLYEPVSGEADVCQTTRGAFEIIFTYFDELKRLGLYDDTTIIVLGDHGRPPNETDGVFNLELESAITTALLIKPAGAEEAPVVFDRWSELSNDYFMASVLEYAGIDHSAYGYSYNDIIENDLHPERYLQSVKFMNYGSLKYTAKYRITGDARDFDNWELLPEHENE